jgi:ABC-type transport system involved in cytochrome c biogenesis permease subunit
MELEQLKTVWKKTTEREVEGYFVSKKEVQRLIGKRSNTTIFQIKRKIRNKVFMAGGIGLMLLAFAAYLFTAEEQVFELFESFVDPTSNLEMGAFYLVFGLVICFISIFNAFSYRKILKIENRKSDLKSTIQSILAILQKAIKVKIYSDTLVIPGTILSLVLIDLISSIGIFPNTNILLVFVLGSVVFATLSYFITTYGQSKRYGSQIRALEDCLTELEEER